MERSLEPAYRNRHMGFPPETLRSGAGHGYAGDRVFRLFENGWRVVTARRWVILLYIALIAAGFFLARALPDWATQDVGALSGKFMPGMMVGVLGLYVLLAAIPFVPGAEIGFALLALFGAQVALTVYGAMVAALTIAFLAGRYVPPAWLAGFMGRLGFLRAKSLIEACHEMPLKDRSDFLAEHVPTRVLPFLLRHKYLTLAVLLNLPGNTLLGGGGGIAFAAGASRIYATSGFLLTIALAVAPFPLAFVLFGWG